MLLLHTWNLDSTLESPQDDSAEQFGDKIDFDGKHLVVNAKNADSGKNTTFDSDTLTLDKDFTRFEFEIDNPGIIYVYENIQSKLIYGQPWV